MQGSSRKPDWKKWSRWLLWWRIDQAEVRREAEAYETLRWFRSARGLSLIVAVLAGAGRWAIAGLFITHGLHGRSETVVALIDSSLLAEGFLFFTLGYLAYRGKRAALAGLMALWTISLAWLYAWYIQYYIAAFTFYVDPVKTSVPVAVTLLGWPVAMHVFYVARRVELARMPKA